MPWYNFFVAEEHSVEFITAVQKNRFEGFLYPTSEPLNLHLLMTEDELLILRLKVPFVYHQIQ